MSMRGSSSSYVRGYQIHLLAPHIAIIDYDHINGNRTYGSYSYVQRCQIHLTVTHSPSQPTLSPNHTSKHEVFSQRLTESYRLINFIDNLKGHVTFKRNQQFPRSHLTARRYQSPLSYTQSYPQAISLILKENSELST